MNIAAYIDHTILKQTTGKNDIEAVCREAKEYGFAAVCIPPFFVKQAAHLVKESSVKVATVIGFPFGYTYPAVKESEARQAIEDGAQELDMVINVAALKDGHHNAVLHEVQILSQLAKDHQVTLKVIIESGMLTKEEIIWCCEAFASHSVDFLKTSTGYAEKGASVDAVHLMRLHLPERVQIKASGGIRNYEFARQLVDAGATRLGCSAGVAITKGENPGSGTY